MDTLVEDNILLLLSDSNLPLGGFHFRSDAFLLRQGSLARLRRPPSPDLPDELAS